MATDDVINPHTRIEKESKCRIENHGFADPPASTVHASKKLKQKISPTSTNATCAILSFCIYTRVLVITLRETKSDEKSPEF